VKYYLSHGSTARLNDFYPQFTFGSHYGDFDIFEKRVYGSPQLTQWTSDLGMEARGTSIQLEIINDVLDQRLLIQGIGYDKKDLYKIKKCETFSI